MILLIGAGVVALLVALMIRGARANRREWLNVLSLPGTWVLRNADSLSVLSFGGGLEAGSYSWREDGHEEEGEWRLRGHTLRLTPNGGEAADFELRAFGDGSIGIDGPGHERCVYLRRRDNVVPLRQRS